MNLKVHITRTKRTDVLCIACNRFGADHVAVLADGSETDYGIHKAKCAPSLHVKRARKVLHAAAE